MANTSLPPEVWCHILSYVHDIDGIIDAKRINRLFYNEMKDKDPLLAVPDIDWKALTGIMKYLSKRRIFTSAHEKVVEYFRSDSVSDVLRNAEHAKDDADRYFVFKALLLGTLDSAKRVPHGIFQRAEPENIYVTTQFVRLTHYMLYYLLTEYWQYTKLLVDEDKVNTKLFMWDVESTDTFDQIPPVYLNFANALLMTFNVNIRSTFKSLIECCIRIMGLYYSRRATVPPLMYLVGVCRKGGESHRAVKAREVELVSKIFNLRYFEVFEDSVSSVTDMMNTITDDMQKSAAGKWVAEKQGLSVLQTDQPTVSNNRWCSIL